MQAIRQIVEYPNSIVDVTNSNCIIMLLPWCYTRDNLSLIHLCCSRRYV